MKTTIFALTIIGLGLAALPSPANAQVVPPPSPPKVVTLTPPLSKMPGGPGGAGADGTPVGSFKAETYQRCGWQLGKLRDVRTAQVDAVADRARVKVIPVCQYTSIVGDQRTNNFLADGNVGGLIGTIGGNAALKASLQAARYEANDVIGIVMLPDHGAILYVHKRS